MEKEDLIEILAKSQEKILNCVDSKLQDLKQRISDDQEDCVRSVVKRFKEDQSISWKKVGNEKQLSLTIPWQPSSIRPLLPLTRRSWIKQSRSYRKSFQKPFEFRQAIFIPGAFRRRAQAGVCFACELEGHWKSNCPNIRPFTRSDKSSK